MIDKVLMFFLLMLTSLTSTVLYADQTSQINQSKWTFGVGIGGVSLPHYRGSDQHADYIAPIPYITYNGERLKIDREGGRFYFYNGKKLKIDVSLAFAVNVSSNDNRARSGMSDLDNIIEIGPRVLFNLYESEDRNLRIRLGVPLRTAYTINLSQAKNIGLVFSPYLQVRYFTSGWETAISLGPMWANELYHDYFYEVAPQYVTATRAAYNAKDGYSGSRLTFTVSKRFDDFYFGLFSRYDDLNGASFIDSPLVKQKNSLAAGIALAWIFNKPNN